MWFRRDLRLADNAALAAAARAPGGMIALYVLDDETPGAWRMGGASRWWLHHSLDALARALARHGVVLCLRRGPAREVVAAVARECGAQAVHSARGHEPWAGALERDLRDRLAAIGCAFKRYAGGLLLEPEALRTGEGMAFKVFTPFWRALSRERVRSPVAAPQRFTAAVAAPRSEALADLALLPRAPDWSGGLAATWTPGEASAARRLDAFLADGLAGYGRARDRPDQDRTSRLSPHLAHGEISPAQCWSAACAAAEAGHVSESDLEAFLRELAWREFSYHLLAERPDLPEQPFRAAFAAFPWAGDPAGERTWQRGRTGYPIVDAGMRELWRTGWMHNRVRMIAASFLVKHLLVPWQAGEAWFWDTLVDADIAANAASWQWVAGSGADAAPYFRIFSPLLQGRKFDPDGAYVRRWVGALAGLPAEHIHAPSAAPAAVLAAAGVRIGDTYPAPVVAHEAARARALAAYARIKGG
jgi:deoxyribodipyrimidine photo-lyase